MGNVTYVREWVDPTRAAKILNQCNIRNRPYRPAHATRLAALMTQGKFKENGDTIAFCGNRLYNGQHRLGAIVESGIGQWMCFARGLEPDCWDSIDCGEPRNGPDTLSNAGMEHNLNVMAAALAVVKRYFDGTQRNHPKIPNHELRMALVEHPGIENSRTWAHRKPRMISATLMVACHYLFSKVNPEKADRFMDSLLSGDDLERDNPIRFLRERLIKILGSRSKPNQTVYMAYTIKTWNAWMEKRKINQLLWRSGGDQPEPFPTIHGLAQGKVANKEPSKVATAQKNGVEEDEWLPRIPARGIHVNE